MASVFVFYSVYVMLFSYVCIKPYSFRTFTNSDMKMYRDKAKQMFQHAYDSYLRNAFPYDELQPISCKGMDTWGSFSLSLIDSLDTLVVMQNYSEFRRVVKTVLETAEFNLNINVSVFETNIRVVGGLLSAHLLSKRAGLDVDPGWPCSGPLLNLAEKVARRLLPAFQTKTGMPYGTVNLRYGVPVGETPITCTAGVSTFILEFGTLSQLTGDPIFEKVAVSALDALWKRRSSLGLVGNHINVQDGKWTALDSGIGGSVDSYFEYLVKGAVLFQEPKFLKMFKELEKSIKRYMVQDDWYFWVGMNTGQVTMPVFQSLEAFWPGLLTLIGNVEQAVKTIYNYHQVWKQYGFTPEIYDVPRHHAKRESYPLRPELIESVMYLYRASKDQHLLEIGVDILESIEHSSKTECGYATINDVVTHKIEDRMESFFLAETTKYLYLLFDPENFIHNNGSCGKILQMSGGNCMLESGGYVFNTEAHPIDIAAVYCCSTKHHEHQKILQKFQRTMDLHSLLEINDRKNFLNEFKQNNRLKSRLKKTSTDTPSALNDTDIPNSHEARADESIDGLNNKSDKNIDRKVMDKVNKFLREFYEEQAKEELSQLSPNLPETITKQVELEANAYDQKDTSVIDDYEEDDPISEDSQNLLKEYASDHKNASYTFLNDTYDEEFHNYELLSCPAQPFISRFNIMGEMFNTY